MTTATASATPTTANKERVPGAFDPVARKYDLMCSLNPGYSRHLRWSAKRLGHASVRARIDRRLSEDAELARRAEQA